ncbi:MAG TPA: flagellar motor switch protein FliG, partial [Anaerolineae bacterium]|nr:flagellar motor switch protein FliG [Anaerolineae bacterium]
MQASRAAKGLNGPRKAAILLISLGAELSAQVLKHCREEEVERLTFEIFNTDRVTVPVRDQVIE